MNEHLLASAPTALAAEQVSRIAVTPRPAISDRSPATSDGGTVERFVIEGGQRLSGRIAPAGNKNAALPALAATLLTNQPVTLDNIPRIGDVVTKLELLKQLGANVERGNTHSWTICARDVGETQPDVSLARRIRTSVLLAGRCSPGAGMCGYRAPAAMRSGDGD